MSSSSANGYHARMSGTPRACTCIFSLLTACGPAEPTAPSGPTAPSPVAAKPAPDPAPAPAPETVTWPAPEPVTTDPAKIRLVAAGGSQVCVIMGDGAVRCLNRGKDAPVPPPLVAVAGVRGATALAVGEDFRCALLADGGVMCWGSNAYGQLGRGDPSEQLHLPAAPVKDLAGVTGLFAGGWHAAALRSDGVVAFWGHNNIGQFGDGKVSEGLVPEPSKSVTVVRELALGSFHGCAVGQDGVVRCWGSNSAGQLGDPKTGDEEVRRAPVVVDGLTDVRHLALGASHSCALRNDQTVRCWGTDEDGQLGDGGRRTSPKPVPVDLRGVVQIAAGGNHTCARLGDGGVRCWGFNATGQLGDGTIDTSRTPTAVVGIGPAKHLAAGDESTCALLKNDELWCWGWRISERPLRIGA